MHIFTIIRLWCWIVDRRQTKELTIICKQYKYVSYKGKKAFWKQLRKKPVILEIYEVFCEFLSLYLSKRKRYGISLWGFKDWPDNIVSFQTYFWVLEIFLMLILWCKFAKSVGNWLWLNPFIWACNKFFDSGWVSINAQFELMQF